MSSKIFTKNKKRFFLAIFAMAVLVLGFWAANIPISNAAEEIYCTTSIANDYANDCESNAENCTFCNDVCADGTRCVSTCTVNPYNYNLESGTPAYTALNACASDSAAFPYTRKCRAGACPDSNDKVTTSGLGLADGDGCVVRVLDGTTVKSASGAWDASEKKCVICYDAAGNDKKDPFVCGSSSGINLTQTSVTPNIWNCTGVGTNKLEAACGLTSPTKCDEKDVEDTCDPGKTCDALGACVAANALTLDVSWSANPVTV
ncbi:hypothetical protein KJ854_05635, partial [Patescibacteria group bacterium]|nr:hypothetical protein [Patescibacteria group bacterium]